MRSVTEQSLRRNSDDDEFTRRHSQASRLSQDGDCSRLSDQFVSEALPDDFMLRGGRSSIVEGGLQPTLSSEILSHGYVAKQAASLEVRPSLCAPYTRGAPPFARPALLKSNLPTYHSPGVSARDACVRTAPS